MTDFIVKCGVCGRNFDRFYNTDSEVCDNCKWERGQPMEDLLGFTDKNGGDNEGNEVDRAQHDLLVALNALKKAAGDRENFINLVNEEIYTCLLSNNAKACAKCGRIGTCTCDQEEQI